MAVESDADPENETLRGRAAARVMTGHHAILSRLETLHEQWGEFIDSGARILRWCVRADELRMIDAFVRLEAHEEGGQLPGLFVHVVEPCEGPGYGGVIAREIASQWTTAETEGELDTGLWDPAPFDPRADEATELAVYLASLQASLTELADYVVLVLTPPVIVDGDAWMIFLGHLALQLGPAVKILILDKTDAPALEPLADALGDKMLTRTADLDMVGAYRSLAKAAAMRDHPGARFRLSFTNLCFAARAADLATVEQHAADARSAARAAEAPEIAVAVELALGQALLGSGEIEGALAAFDAARVDAASSPPEVAARLELIALVARGAALVQAGDFVRGAQTYREAADLASFDDLPTCVDAWRMVSYCHERSQDDDLAWEAGQAALSVADELDRSQRQHSTLPFLGVAMISLAERRCPDQVVELEVRMVQLMGTHAWRPS